jgi:tRNA dimethylallyltransferase
VAWDVQEKLLQKTLGTKIKVIVLAGPTGVGKTSTSLELARLLSGEIISADSMQVYRGMDIGTAKVSSEVRQDIPHHLIDICDISEPFNVRNFFDAATQAMLDIAARGNVPIVAGGTGFYIHSLPFGPPAGPPSDPVVRAYIESEEEKFGPEFLYEKLMAFDPEYAKTITPRDRHKIVRGLEIIEISNQKVSDFAWKVRPKLSSFDFRCWFLHMPKEPLYQRLHQRCDQMLQEGFLAEVVELDRAGIRENTTASAAVGYRQALDFLASGKTPEDYEHFVKDFKTASRHLAKRQFTWFRKEPDFQWVNVLDMPHQQLIEMIADDLYQ